MRSIRDRYALDTGPTSNFRRYIFEASYNTEPMMYPYLGQSSQKLRRDAGNWLRALRERRGLSQRELAKRVGIGYYTLIAQLEHGRGRIPSSQYLVWAQALGIEPDEFNRGLTSFFGPGASLFL
jgi:ribosome-binding protein aMBF1 (putative translation factor)